jgi:RNA polymerase sigma-70 factor (ECF subfamily)
LPTIQPSRADRFEQLAAPLEKQIYFSCLSMMGNREDAEDCAQDAMLRAYRALDSFRGDSSFLTWLYAIAVRACLDALRKRKETFSLDFMREEGWDIPDTAPDAYLQLEEKERRRILKAAIALLPPDFRGPQVLVDLQGLSYQEAAEALGLPLGTLKSRVHRARQALYKSLCESRELLDIVPRPIDERRVSDVL